MFARCWHLHVRHRSCLHDVFTRCWHLHIRHRICLHAYVHSLLAPARQTQYLPLCMCSLIAGTCTSNPVAASMHVFSYCWQRAGANNKRTHAWRQLQGLTCNKRTHAWRQQWCLTCSQTLLLPP